MIFGGRFASGGAFFTGRFAPNSSPLARYSIGGKAPAVIADTVAGVYGLGGRSVDFDSLFTFSRLSAAWKLNALGHWVKVLAGEPRTGHHVWKGGKLVPAGIAVCSEVRTNLASYSEDLLSWELANEVTVTPQGSLGGSPSFVLSDQTTTYGHPRQVIGPIGEGEFTCQVKVAKTVGKTNAFGIRIVYTAGGVTHFNGISFNAETGGGILPTWSSSIIERVVQDCGDYWLAWFSFDTTGIGSNDARVEIFPAHNGVNGATGATRTGDHRCTAVDVNEGRYPQDYIKTEATPVSVASESLEIDPVKLAKAVGVFGPELVANSDFSDGLTGWVAASGANLSITPEGGLSVENDPSDSISLASQQFPTEVDALYLVEIDIASATDRRFAGVSTSQSGVRDLLPFGINDEVGKLSGFFIGTGSDVHLQLGSFDNGAITLYRSATVRKVTMPEALTFVIKGFMTYEDGDQWDEVVPVEIGTLGAGINYLAMGLGTTGGLTGQMRFLHRSDGGWSTVLGPDDKAPGVLVPFSYAQTVGNGLNQGASDGVLSSAASPASIANILGQILHLAKRGDFCLTEFAIYVGNPGSAALQEATS